MGRAVARAIRRACAAVWAGRAELLVATAMLGGWALTTWGIAALTVWQVWPISAGLALFALVGFRLLGTIAARGLYVLSRGARG